MTGFPEQDPARAGRPAGTPTPGPGAGRGVPGRDRAASGPPPAGEEVGVGRAPAGSSGDPGAEPSGSDTGADDVEADVPGGTILTDVATLAAERDEYLGALQRLKADFDNYRKRVLRQQEEQTARAAADLVGKLLPVLDTLDLASVHLGAGSGEEVTEGVRALAQTRSQLLDVLAREGLERVDVAEVPFDPTVHDAVAHAPAPDPAPASTSRPTDADVAANGSVGGSEPGAGGQWGDAPSAGSAPAEGATPYGVDAPEGRGGGGGSSSEPGGPAAAGGGVSVDEVLRAGYRWRGQVLRPAMVRVRG